VATHLGLENFFATEKLRAKEIASQLPLDGLHGAMTQSPHVAATQETTQKPAVSSHNNIRQADVISISLIDCVCIGCCCCYCCIHFAFGFLGRAILHWHTHIRN